MTDQAINHESEENRTDRYASQETVPADVDTRIESLTQRFFFHEMIKDGEFARHYIVEDIEVDPATLNDPEAPLFYYLKQMKFKDKAEFLFAKKFYMKIFNYCKMPFAKNDIVNLNYIFDFDNDNDEYFELILVYDYGESDRIDVENISTAHINKFLKNVCLLLNDLKKFDGIYHGNIFLKNIILVNSELKLSGFKARHLDNDNVKSWKNELAKIYGVHRLDLYLIGLLWLVFLNVHVDSYIDKEFTLSEVKQNVKRLIHELPEQKRMDIVLKLLDLENQKDLTLDDIILDFDEYYILENIKIEDDSRNRYTMDKGYDGDNKNYHYDSQENEHQGEYDKELRKSPSKDTNPFIKPYRESERDIQNKNKDEENTAQLYDSRDPGNMIKIDGVDFTLRDENSINLNRQQGDEVITIKDVNRSLSHDANDIYDIRANQNTENRKTTDPSYNKNDKSLLQNRHNSEKQFLRISEEQTENKMPSMRKLKSNAVLNSTEQADDKTIKVSKEYKLSNIQQEAEEGSEEERVENVYSYRNILESKSSNSKAQKDSINKKLSSIVGNRYNTDEASDNEGRYNSFEVDGKHVNLVESVEQYDRIGIQGERRNVSVNNTKVSTKQSGVSNKVSVNLSKNNDRQSKGKNSMDVSRKESTPYRLSKFNDENAVIIDSNNRIEDTNSLDKEKKDNKEQIEMNQNNSNDDGFENSPRESKDALKISKERLLSDLKQNNIENDEKKVLSEEPQVSTKFSKATDKKIEEKNIDIEVPRTLNIKTKNSIDAQVEPKTNVADIKLSSDNKPKEKIDIKKNKTPKNSKSTEKIKKQKSDGKEKEERSKSRKKELVKRPPMINNSRSTSNNKSKSVEKLKPRKNVGDRPKNEWDEEIEREEEAKRRAKEIENAVKFEAEKRKQEEEEKRRNEREALLIRETERIQKEQELKSKIEKKLKARLEEKEKQKKQDVDKNKEEKMAMEEDNARREAEELEKMQRRQYNRDKSSEKIIIGYKKNNSSELSKQHISYNRLASSKEKKEEKSGLEILDKKMKKAVQLSSVVDRKNLFLYNEDMSNKNISFKKMLTNSKIFDKSNQHKSFKDQVSINKVDEVEVINDEHLYDNLPGFDTYQKNIESAQAIENTSSDRINQAKMNNSAKTGYKETNKQFVDNHNANRLLENINNKDTNKFVKSNMELSIKTAPPKKTDNMDKLVNTNELNKIEEIKDIKPKKPIDRSYLDIAFEKGLSNDYNYKSDKKNISNDVRNSDTDRKLEPPTIQKNDVEMSIEEVQKDEISSDMDDEEFDEKITEIQNMIEANEYNESLHHLIDLLDQVGGLKKVDTYKIIAMVHFKIKDFKQSITNLKRCIDFIDDNPGLPNSDEIKRSVFISLVVSLLETRRYQEAVNCLESDLFINKEDTPSSYFTLLGDAYRELARYDEANKAYEEQLKRYMTKELDGKAIKSLFLLVNKMIMTLNAIGDEVQLVKFYRQILNYADSLVKVDSTFKNSSQEYTTIKEHLLLAILNMLLIKENYNLSNYILNDIIRDKLVDYGKLDDEDKLRFCDTYLSFSMYLKDLPNYGGQKDCYIKYLRQALCIVKKCELTEDNVKKELVITFNEGLYYLNQNEYQKAKDCFDESLRLYNSRYVEPDSELFTILYNIGLSLYSMGKYEDCGFYFEKIIHLNCPEDHIRTKTLKILSKTYYRLGEYQKCYDVIQGWIYHNLSLNDKEAKNFYIYLAIYFICCVRTHSSNFEHILAQMKKNLEDQPEAENIHYFNIFFNLTNLSYKNKNYKQNEEVVNQIKELLKEKNKSSFGEEFISLMCRFYNRYVLNKNDYFMNDDEFLMTLCAPELPVEDNANKVTTFLLNFMFILMNKLPTDPHKEPSKKFRNQLLEDIRLLKQHEVLYKNIVDVLVSAVEKTRTGASNKEVEKFILEVKDKKPDKFVLQDSEKELDMSLRSKSPVKVKTVQATKQDNKPKVKKTPKTNIKIEQKELYEEIMQKEVKEDQVQEKTHKPSTSFKRLKRINSEDIDQKWNLKKRTKCICFEPNRKKVDLISLIDEFLKQIKNMLFLDITEKIPEYYTRFEEIIKEKRLNWEKYIYIKKLFNFYLKNRFGTLDTKKFSVLLETLITEQPLCIHDYKMMLIFLESFKDVAYIEAFVIHMDKYHPHMSSIIFQQLFLDNFESKYAKIKADLFKKINSGKFNIIENYPFIHYLNENNNLIIEKEFQFKVYQRLRYVVLNDKAFFPIFNKSIDVKTISNFYLRYNVYCALVESIRKENDGFKVISTYLSVMTELLNSQQVQFDNCEFFMYDNLLLIILLRFNSPDNKEIGDKIIEMMLTFENNIGDSNMYHFALVASLAGSVLFKNKLHEHSIKAKSMAFDAMRKIKGDEVIFPAFYKEVDPKTLVFNILSYMLMNNIILSRKEAVEQFYKKIANFDTNNKKVKIEQACFNALYLIYHKDFEKAKYKLDETHKLITESKLNSLYLDMFIATVDRLALEVFLNTGKNDEIHRQREKSRGSINKLYNNLVAEP